MRRSLATVTLSILACGALLGAVDPATVGPTNSINLALSVGTGPSGGADTTRIIVGHSTYPISSVAMDSTTGGERWLFADTHYDDVRRADDGTAVRWGCTRVSAPTVPFVTAQAGGQEANAGEANRPSHPVYSMFIAFNLADIPAGSRVENASVMINSGRFGGGIDLTTGYIAARLDTVAADYAMIATSTGDTIDGSDLCYLNTSYSQVDRDPPGVAWTPPLALRDDWHDFGISSVRYAPGYDVEDLGTVRLDVTDAVQQWVDRGNPFGGWAIFWIYRVGAGTTNETWMYGDAAVHNTKGSPTFTATVTSKRGQKAWGRVHVPILLSVDDGHAIHAKYLDIVRAGGGIYSEVANYSAWHSAGGALLNQAQRDSIWAANQAAFVPHSRTHTGLGTFGTDNEIDYELTRDWLLLDDVITGFDASDTLGLLDFAWPGGGSDAANYSFRGVSRLVENGYKSSRAAAQAGWSAAIGARTTIGLDVYVNTMNLESYHASAIFGSGTALSAAAMRDTVMDYIDDAWTTGGRSPASFYWHNNAGGAEQGSYALVSALVDLINDSEGMGFMSLPQARAFRLAGQSYIAPASITEANGATLREATSAARYDSVYTADSDDNMLRVWVGPK